MLRPGKETSADIALMQSVKSKQRNATEEREQSVRTEGIPFLFSMLMNEVRLALAAGVPLMTEGGRSSMGVTRDRRIEGNNTSIRTEYANHPEHKVKERYPASSPHRTVLVLRYYIEAEVGHRMAWRTNT